ncbi:MAG: hypothetical protein NTY51_14845 [Deltaproteobacteria bacterium]|nr:hypothetical protein [Deltaproteobacteria bacterium]
MKRIILLAITIALFYSPAKAQLLEMAANCDDASIKIIEIIKHPDAKTAQKIRDMFGVDIFNSCDSPDGKVICFQCLDKNQQLNLIQLHENKATKIFELKGPGCKCNKTE